MKKPITIHVSMLDSLSCALHNQKQKMINEREVYLKMKTKYERLDGQIHRAILDDVDEFDENRYRPNFLKKRVGGNKGESN